MLGFETENEKAGGVLVCRWLTVGRGKALTCAHMVIDHVKRV